MVALDLISQLDKLRFVDSAGLDDFADRCSYLLSFVLIFVCFTIVTVKSYVFEPLSCYVPTTFSGSNLGPYINAFCWVNGTTPLSADTDRLDDQSYWHSLEDRKTNYYQWVSLVLATQAIFCYIPRLIWEAIMFNRVGTNLGFLVESAQVASNESGKDRENRIQFVANVMDTLLFARRELKQSAGELERKLEKSQSIWHLLSNLFPKKRLGTALTFYYMVIKFMYLFNSIGQLVMMQRFLGLTGDYSFFGLAILSNLIHGRGWNETHVFPRVGFCRVPIKLTSTPIPMVTVQCTLPINMLNEKIYVFLWFWFVFITAIEVASVAVWFYRLAARQSRLRLLVRYLKIADAYDEDMDPLLTRFETTFLRTDGSFLLHMLHLNAGSLITQEILQAMLKRYTEQEQYALMQRKRASKPLQQEICLNNREENMRSQFSYPDSVDCAVTKRLDAV